MLGSKPGDPYTLLPLPLALHFPEVPQPEHGILFNLETSQVPLEGAQVPPVVRLPQFANHWVRVSREGKHYVNEMSPRGQQTRLSGVSVSSK